MTNDRFIELLTHELCNQLTENERVELFAVLHEKSSYRLMRKLFLEYWQREKGEYETSSALFKKVQEKIRLQEFEMSGEPEMEVDQGGVKRKWYRIARYAAAAVVIGIIGLLVFSRAPKDRPTVRNSTIRPHWVKKSTRPAQKEAVKLDDGTAVTLNSATTLSFPERFTDSTREIYLEGEAYFDVAKDASRPFIIHAGKMNIRVLGTSFNIKSYKNEAFGEASLIQGSIEVTLNDRPADRIILKPKEKLIVQDNVATKRTLDSSPRTQDSTGKNTRYSLTSLSYFPNTDKTVIETSWVENKLVFSGKDFIDLAGQLERWYGVHIEFRNDRVKHYNFTGFFEKETLREALDALRLIDKFQYKIVDSTVSIY